MMQWRTWDCMHEAVNKSASSFKQHCQHGLTVVRIPHKKSSTYFKLSETITVKIFSSGRFLDVERLCTSKEKINHKKQFGRFLAHPLFEFGPSIYSYHVGIESTRAQKNSWVLTPSSKRDKNQKMLKISKI